MRAVIRLIMLVAFRDRLFSGLAGLIVLTVGISLFLGNSAMTETGQAGAVYASGTLRIVLALGLGFFVAIQTQRLFESREIEAILSRSISRSAFVVAYWLGFSAVAFLLVALVAGIFIFLYGFASSILAWSLSLLLECLVMIAFTQFAALTLERATTTIFVNLAFYGFARLIGFFLGIREATPSIGVNRILNPMIDGLGMVIPRLDLMTQSSWLIYGFDQADMILFILAQATVFICLVLSASAFDLRRKRF